MRDGPVPNMTGMKFTSRAVLIAAALGVAGALATACSSSPSMSPGATASSPAPSPASSPSPGQEGGASTASRAVTKAAHTGEAQALGVTPKQLTQALRQGQTVQQLAGARNMDQTAFRSAFSQKLQPQLDQLVQQGTLTQDQAKKALSRLTQKIPNWDRAPRPRSSPASPAPSSSPASQ